MAENSAISWTDDTFNPWIGCTKVSPACDGCYAEALMDTRYGRVKWGPHGERVRTSASNWAKPLKWNREVQDQTVAWLHAGENGPMPTRFVFCASLADVFDNAVPMEWRRDLFDLIRATPHLTWLLLTKRPGNIVKLFHDIVYGGPLSTSDLIDYWPRNAAIGCTVVTQEEADRDIPKLLAAKAALKPAFAFVSMEPLLGPVDLTRTWLWFESRQGERATALVGLDWVITGGETDQGKHKARPSHPDWFRSLRDQCAAAGVAYHHKQNGEWAACKSNDGEWPTDRGNFIRLLADGGRDPAGWPMQKAGKKAAGRLLDGVTHDARPEVTHA